MKLSTAPSEAAKKRERKVGKGKGKETYPGYFGNPLRSARARLRVKRPKPTCSYEFAGAAADEVAKTVWGTRHDRNIWAGFCRYGNVDDIIDRDPLETLKETFVAEHKREMNERQESLLKELLSSIND